MKHTSIYVLLWKLLYGCHTTGIKIKHLCHSFILCNARGVWIAPRTVAYACRIWWLKWTVSVQRYNWTTLSLGNINMEAWSSRLWVGHGANNPIPQEGILMLNQTVALEMEMDWPHGNNMTEEKGCHMYGYQTMVVSQTGEGWVEAKTLEQL